MRLRVLFSVAVLVARLWARGAGTRGEFIVMFAVLQACSAIALVFGLTGSLVGFALFALCQILAWPSVIGEHVFVRLGMWRPAYVMGWLARIAWNDHGGVVLAAWALHRQRRPSERGMTTVSRQIREQRFGAGAVFAAGMVASARGDQAAARTLLESLPLLDPKVDRRAHLLAGELLIAQAAKRGDWRRVRRLADSGLSTRWSRLLRAVASRLLYDELGAASDAAIIAYWLAAPRRRATRQLVREAMQSGRASTHAAERWPAPREHADNAGARDLGDALALHLDVTRGGSDAVELEELVGLATAWDSVCESQEIETLTRERAAVLQSRSADRASAEFVADIGADIADIIRRSRHRLDLLPSGSPTLARAASLVRENLLSGVEMASTALLERSEHLPAIDEWREFLAIRAQHAELATIGGLAVRQLAFPPLHHSACNHAVGLWNSRGEYLIAGVIFNWLLAEARIVGDQRAIELQKQNCDVAV